MGRELSGWQLFSVGVIFFFIFAFTHLNVIGAIADIAFLIAIVVGIRNHRKSRSERA
jgi:hypothetical protein